MKKIINTGLIGFGNSGQTFFAPFIAANPGFKLAKISTSDPEKVAKANKVYPTVEVVNSADDIINDPNIDLVLVGSPNTSHFELTKKALLAGKHVLVEKPFTVITAEADELIALAKKQGRVLSVHHNRRFDSGHNTVKKALVSGILGTVVEMEVHYDRYRLGLRPQAWREKPMPGSGIFYDLGAHLIDATLDLFGKPTELTCMLTTQRPGGLEVEDNFELIMWYPGLKVTMKSGMLVKEAGPVYTIYGYNGTFIKYGMDVQEEALKAGHKPSERNWGVEPESIWGHVTLDDNGKTITQTIPSEPGRYQDLFQNVYEAIAEGKELIVQPEQARTTIRIIELAFQSSREKRTVPYSD
ncbi:MAG: oxidoreductase [Sphingobacteriales bacterium]